MEIYTDERELRTGGLPGQTRPGFRTARVVAGAEGSYRTGRPRAASTASRAACEMLAISMLEALKD
jgi:hypothetical protein